MFLDSPERLDIESLFRSEFKTIPEDLGRSSERATGPQQIPPS
jgi:hypothetical protein